jgi:pyruvate/2-oxoacid:ferredoxin oxidoreductase beta subunit
MNEEDLKIVEAMETYGGSFVKALANAARHADHYNLGKIRQTWSEYWDTYREMAIGVEPTKLKK